MLSGTDTGTDTGIAPATETTGPSSGATSQPSWRSPTPPALRCQPLLRPVEVLACRRSMRAGETRRPKARKGEGREGEFFGEAAGRAEAADRLQPASKALFAWPRPCHRRRRGPCPAERARPSSYCPCGVFECDLVAAAFSLQSPSRFRGAALSSFLSPPPSVTVSIQCTGSVSLVCSTFREFAYNSKMHSANAATTIDGDFHERMVLTCEHAGSELPTPWRWSDEAKT